MRCAAARPDVDDEWQQRAVEAATVFRHAKRLHDLAAMDQALARVAQALNDRFEDQPPPVLLCALTGAMVMTGRLLPLLSFLFELDYLHLTRYGNSVSGGDLRNKSGPTLQLKGRTVLLVDDILDKGTTLAQMWHICQEAGASAICAAVMVEKLCPREVDVACDYAAIQVPDHYVFGYGLDYKGFLRNAPGLYAVANDTPDGLVAR